MPRINQPIRDLASILTDIRRRLRKLETARPLESAVISRGSLKITDAGSLYVLQPGSSINASLIMGAQLGVLAKPDGSPQMAFALYRDSGQLAFAMFDPEPLVGGYQQFVAMYDLAGNIIVSDDVTAGRGLAVPYIPFGPFMSNGAPTDTTTSATYATLQTAIGTWMNPKMFIQVLVRSSDATTTGNVRIVDQSSNVIGAPVAVAANQFGYVTFGPVAMPGTFKQTLSLNIQAQRTAGTGTIGVRGIGAYGMQS